MGRSLKALSPQVVLSLCLIAPLAFASWASSNARPSPSPYLEDLRQQTSEVAAWTHLDEALPLLERAQAAEVGILAYQVTIAAAAANCREPDGSPGVAPDEADKLARRVYAHLSCSAAPLPPRQRSWGGPRPPRPIRRSAQPLQPPLDIEAAIERGAEVTGVSPDYLRRTAIAESGLRSAISAEASSAQGLYQFLEGTWLATVHRYGSGLGLSRAVSAIEIDASGHARVTDPNARADILALRTDPLISTALAGMLTRENAARLAASGLGAVDDGSLYAAHVLGARGAAILYGRLLHRPQDRAARSFAAAAYSNPALFRVEGRPISVGGLEWVLRQKVGG